MDVCTLVVINIMTTLACIPAQVCTVEDGKKFCKAGPYIECNRTPEPYYHCVPTEGLPYDMKMDRKTVIPNG